jgi:hypothetical protein
VSWECLFTPGQNSPLADPRHDSLLLSLALLTEPLNLERLLDFIVNVEELVPSKSITLKPFIPRNELIESFETNKSFSGLD